jgi:hypothetical protein
MGRTEGSQTTMRLSDCANPFISGRCPNTPASTARLPTPRPNGGATAPHVAPSEMMLRPLAAVAPTTQARSCFRAVRLMTIAEKYR